MKNKKISLALFALLTAAFLPGLAFAITLEEIAMHNTAADCWTAINGNVYDLTSYISGHPGGQAIVAICGIDGTDIFLGQHGSGYLAIVSSFQIGVLTTADTTPPVITMNGLNPVSIYVSEAYTDAGASALDDVDGAVAVSVSGTVDTAVIGEYSITYTATDAAGNTATAVRIVNVIAMPEDTTPPVITLSGANPVSIVQSTVYVDAGATAIDNVDGTVSVSVTGTVDTATIGTYTLTYTAMDTAGNTATATRTVNVVASAPPEDEEEYEDETEEHEDEPEEEHEEEHEHDEEMEDHEHQHEDRHWERFDEN